MTEETKLKFDELDKRNKKISQEIKDSFDEIKTTTQSNDFIKIREILLDLYKIKNNVIPEKFR